MIIYVKTQPTPSDCLSIC